MNRAEITQEIRKLEYKKQELIEQLQQFVSVNDSFFRSMLADQIFHARPFQISPTEFVIVSCDLQGNILCNTVISSVKFDVNNTMPVVVTNELGWKTRRDWEHFRK